MGEQGHGRTVKLKEFTRRGLNAANDRPMRSRVNTAVDGEFYGTPRVDARREVNQFAISPARTRSDAAARVRRSSRQLVSALREFSLFVWMMNCNDKAGN